MLAKLRYLKREEKALEDIEEMVTKQITRLKQEEFYLKSLLRQSGDKTKKDRSSSSISLAKQAELLDDDTVNTVPLDDLLLTSHQPLHYKGTEEPEEEEEDDEMDTGDCHRNQEENDISRDLMALMQQMQEADSPQDEDDS